MNSRRIIIELAWFLLKWTAAGLTSAVIFYILLSNVVSTDVEKVLSRENRAYAQWYDSLSMRQRVLADVVESLQERDDDLYGSLFHAEAPVADPLSLIVVKRESVDSLEARITAVEKAFARIFHALATKDTLPPMMSPLEKVPYVLMGASVGTKYNPFYKISTRHEGLDISASRGEPVYAVEAGVVTSVIHSPKGLGNRVLINHGNGYFTRYCQLDAISVRKGQKVRRGQKIAEVGASGTSFAPHLHYEIIRDTIAVDPINYLFASLTPDEYVQAAYNSSRTQQSLD